MEWLKNLLSNNPIGALICPSALSCISFFGNLFGALQDGNIDPTEFHNLMMSASGIQMVLLFAIMFALRAKNKDKK